MKYKRRHMLYYDRMSKQIEVSYGLVILDRVVPDPTKLTGTVRKIHWVWEKNVVSILWQTF